MTDILKSITSELPKSISDAGFEGANIVLYTTDKDFFREGETKIKDFWGPKNPRRIFLVRMLRN